MGPWLGQLSKVAGSAAQRMRSLLQDVDASVNGWSKQGLQGVRGEYRFLVPDEGRDDCAFCGMLARVESSGGDDGETTLGTCFN